MVLAAQLASLIMARASFWIWRHSLSSFGSVTPILGGFSFGTSIGLQLYAKWTAEAKNLPDLVILTGSAALRFRHAEARAPEDALVIHGEDDDVVPLSEVMEWARTVAMPIVVIPEAGHFFHGKLLVLRQIILNRIKACL